LSGCFSLVLSLICVVSSFRYATTMADQDAVMLWFFFLWGLGLAGGSVWLIRGRSKGQAVVFAKDWKRLVIAAALTLVVVGMLIYMASQPSLRDDRVWWPILLQTMFAILFASVPFVLFDREDYKERQVPTKLDAEGRRRVGQRIIVVAAVGAVLLTSGIGVGLQIDSWWQEMLVQLGVALLAASVFLWFRLGRSNRRDAGTDAK
jgi:hypothetical protein